MITLLWILAIVVTVPAIVFVVLRVAAEMHAELRLRKKIAATKRTERIDGKDYVVVTQSLPVLREKRTGRIGIVLERGLENDPALANGRIGFEPRWVKVQFVRKSDGKGGRVEWRSCAKFEAIGMADVDFLTHRAGLLRTESLMRYPADLGKSQSLGL